MEGMWGWVLVREWCWDGRRWMKRGVILGRDEDGVVEEIGGVNVYCYER